MITSIKIFEKHLTISNFIHNEINSNFVNFLKWCTPNVEKAFSMPKLIMQEDDWQELIINSENGTITPDQINQGLCEQFSLYLKQHYHECEIIGDRDFHVYVKYHNMYYDSENPTGAISPDTLYSDEAEFFKNRKNNFQDSK